jgi:hypothetical protein
MTIDFEWIFIIDKDGTLLFGCKRTKQSSIEDFRLVASNYLFTLRPLAKDLVSDQIKRIEIGNNQYLLTQDNSKKYLFIVKCNRNANADHIKPILIAIKQKAMEKFTDFSTLIVPEKQELINSFNEDVKTIFQSFNCLDLEFLRV